MPNIGSSMTSDQGILTVTLFYDFYFGAEFVAPSAHHLHLKIAPQSDCDCDLRLVATEKKRH